MFLGGTIFASKFAARLVIIRIAFNGQAGSQTRQPSRVATTKHEEGRACWPNMGF
jgi:hypothetical protein